MQANGVLPLAHGATNTGIVWFTNTHTHMDSVQKDYLANTCSHLHIMMF